jgi:hypothetical protein
MLGMIHELGHVAHHVLHVHKAAAHRPRHHARLILGHCIELGALGFDAMGFPLLYHSMGITGMCIIVYHLLTTGES